MVSLITLRHGASSPSPIRRHLEMGVDSMTNVSQREVGSRKGVAVLQAKAKKFAESVRPLLEEDDLAGLSAHATARELNRRSVPTPRGGAWTANSVLKLKARLPNRGPADHPIEGPSE